MEHHFSAVISKRKIILITSGLVLGLLLAVSFLPVWRQIKNWRALNLIDEASQLVQEQSWQKARERIQAAYHLAPVSLPVVRRVAQFYDEVKASDASGFWMQAYGLSNDRSDLEAAIRSELMAEHAAQAYLLLDQLLEQHPENFTSLILQAQVYNQLGRIADAMETTQKALDHPEATEEARLVFAQIALRTSDPSAQTQAVEWLNQLRTQPSENGLKALRILGELSLSEENKKALARQLTDHPLATIEDKLFALTLLASLPDSDPTANLEAAKRLFSPITLQAKVTLGRWLNRQGRQTQTVELISPEEALRRQDLYLVYLDALASLKKWNEVQDALDRPNVPLDSYLIALFETRVFIETGKPKQAHLSWGRAILEAGYQPSNLWYLYHYARRIGWTDFAREVLERLEEFPSSRRASYVERVQLESLERNTPATLNYLNKLTSIYPDDTDIQSDLLYLQLLTSNAPSDSVERANTLVETKPELLAYRMTLALALLANNQPEEALNSLNALNIDWSRVRGNWQAILAAILYANNQKDLADRLTQQIPLQAILPEEAALLETYRK